MSGFEVRSVDQYVWSLVLKFVFRDWMVWWFWFGMFIWNFNGFLSVLILFEIKFVWFLVVFTWVVYVFWGWKFWFRTMLGPLFNGFSCLINGWVCCKVIFTFVVITELFWMSKGRYFQPDYLGTHPHFSFGSSMLWCRWAALWTRFPKVNLKLLITLSFLFY